MINGIGNTSDKVQDAPEDSNAESLFIGQEKGSRYKGSDCIEEGEDQEHGKDDLGTELESVLGICHFVWFLKVNHFGWC